MDIESWSSLGLFMLLVILSAFFSGSESAFFSLDPLELEKFRDKKTRSFKRLVHLQSQPRRVLMSILVGNTFVNVAAATVAAFFTHRHFYAVLGEEKALIAEIAVVTLIILICSEVTPKIMAVKRPLDFMLKVSWPLSVMVKVFYPVTYIFELISRSASLVFIVKKSAPFMNEEEIKTLIQAGEEEGTLDAEEREMIHSIFEFGDTTVKEIMIPRMDMAVVEKETTLSDILDLVRQKGHSRIPVYDEKVDNILGILFVKDLLQYMDDNTEIPSLKRLARKPYFVPETKMIDDLLREFQKERIHMAIVVDEYGGTAGLITLEDVLEEIVGEIRDEYDREKPLIQSVNDHTWVVDGKINIEELNEELGLALPTEDDYDSLGGFILSLMGRIPQVKDETTYQNLTLTVQKVDGQRIMAVQIVKHLNDESVQDD